MCVNIHDLQIHKNHQTLSQDQMIELAQSELNALCMASFFHFECIFFLIIAHQYRDKKA